MGTIPPILVSSDNALSNLHFIEESHQRAMQHEWLYHCTTDAVFLNILNTREFWLSTLKQVNDKEEFHRIDVPHYENTYYICSFTYSPNIPQEHWNEYGNNENGVLIGVKQDWFTQATAFMNSDNIKCPSTPFTIYASYNEAFKAKIVSESQSERRVLNPFYISEFGFYQVVYDDNLKKTISGTGNISSNDNTFPIKILTPKIAGIVKSTKGPCSRRDREPYEKSWESEKEVRLKVQVLQLDNIPIDNPFHNETIMYEAFFPKLSVALSEDAFDTIRIKFSPGYKHPEKFISQLKELSPLSYIERFE